MKKRKKNVHIFKMIERHIQFGSFWFGENFMKKMVHVMMGLMIMMTIVLLLVMVAVWWQSGNDDNDNGLC